MAQVISQVSGAITSALEASHPYHEVIQGALHILTQLENRPRSLAREAYCWFTMIWKSHRNYEDWETLLLLAFEVGFRHLHLPDLQTPRGFSRVEHSQELIDTVLKSGDSEAITDLVYASYMFSSSRQRVFSACVNHMVSLRSKATGPFPPRLREIFSPYVERGDFVALEEMGEERFTELLNGLHIGIKDMTLSGCTAWTTMLLKVIRSPGGVRRLAIQSWELLVELATSGFPESAAYNPDATASLLEAREWEKLEYWLGVVWMAWPPGPGDGMIEDLEHTTALLLHKRPGAIHKLTRWIERRSKNRREDVPESFLQICKQIHTSTP